MPIATDELDRLIEGWDSASREYKEAILKAISGKIGQFPPTCSTCGGRPAVVHRYSPGKFHYIWKCFMDLRTAAPSDLFCERCWVWEALGDDEPSEG